jgi:hypothetical protein
MEITQVSSNDRIEMMPIVIHLEEEQISSVENQEQFSSEQQNYTECLRDYIGNTFICVAFI